MEPMEQALYCFVACAVLAGLSYTARTEVEDLKQTGSATKLIAKQSLVRVLAGLMSAVSFTLGLFFLSKVLFPGVP